MKIQTLISLLALLLLASAPCVLSEEPRPAAPDETKLNEAWNALSPRDKASALRLHNALRQMPPEERKIIHERIERFIQMSPDERHKLKENNDRWQKMTPEQRQQARDKFNQRRKEFEDKWRKEHPGQEPPPFPYHHRKQDGSTNTISKLSEPKTNPQETQP